MIPQKVTRMEQYALKKGKQLFEYQHLLLLRDIWWSKFNLYLIVVHFFNKSVNYTSLAA